METTILERIKAEMALFDEKKKALIAELQKEFPVMFAEIFAQAPNLKSFGWTQYTPYFNDGDSCEFGTNFSYPYINGANEDYDEEGEISINPIDYATMKTEADVAENNALAEEFEMSWYKGKVNIGDRGLIRNQKYDASAAKAVEAIQEGLRSIPEDFFKDMFGDHVKVTMYSDGEIEVEEYSHD